MMTTKTFLDGIAFYKDDEEIAFYSNITKRVRYIDNIIYRDPEIDFEDNLYILNTITEYINSSNL